jgi:hypothetical protein
VSKPEIELGQRLTVSRIESLPLPASERALLLPIAAIWEFEVGDDAPVMKLDVTTAASGPREAVDDDSHE